MELDRGVQVQVKRICDEGRTLINMGELQDAFMKFSKAYSLVPEPKKAYAVTAAILAGLDEVYFRAKDYRQGKEALSSLEDPKYFEFLESRRKPPTAARVRDSVFVLSLILGATALVTLATVCGALFLPALQVQGMTYDRRMAERIHQVPELATPFNEAAWSLAVTGAQCSRHGMQATCVPFGADDVNLLPEAIAALKDGQRALRVRDAFMQACEPRLDIDTCASGLKGEVDDDLAEFNAWGMSRNPRAAMWAASQAPSVTKTASASENHTAASSSGIRDSATGR